MATDTKSLPSFNKLDRIVTCTIRTSDNMSRTELEIRVKNAINKDSQLLGLKAEFVRNIEK